MMCSKAAASMAPLLRPGCRDSSPAVAARSTAASAAAACSGAKPSHSVTCSCSCCGSGGCWAAGSLGGLPSAAGGCSVLSCLLGGAPPSSCWPHWGVLDRLLSPAGCGTGAPGAGCAGWGSCACMCTCCLSIRGARWHATAAGKWPCVRPMPKLSTLHTCGGIRCIATVSCRLESGWAQHRTRNQPHDPCLEGLADTSQGDSTQRACQPCAPAHLYSTRVHRVVGFTCQQQLSSSSGRPPCRLVLPPHHPRCDQQGARGLLGGCLRGLLPAVAGRTIRLWRLLLIALAAAGWVWGPAAGDTRLWRR